MSNFESFMLLHYMHIYILAGYKNGKENSMKKDVANTKVYTKTMKT